MAFSVDARVQVSNEHLQHRGHLGTVLRVVGDNHYVRIDGHAADAETLFDVKDLRSSTIAAPVAY